MRQLKISKQITNRESQSLDKYLQEIGKVDLLTPDEEVTLAQKIREGDQLSLERLTKANLRFVVSVAKQYQNQGLSLGDLINEGNLGLIKAAQRFDETKGFKFISRSIVQIRKKLLENGIVGHAGNRFYGIGGNIIPDIVNLLFGALPGNGHISC